jgi:two-component sensor histidine kinase
MHEAVNYCLNLTETGPTYLHIIEQQMKIVADLSRSDILLCGRKSGHEAIVLAHAQPRSIARVYSAGGEGKGISAEEQPEILRTLTTGRIQKDLRGFIAEGAPVVRQIFPIHFPPLYPPPGWDMAQNGQKPRVVAVISIVTNLLEHERHRLRSRVFRRAIKRLQEMLLHGQLVGAEELSPFGEQDGILFIDNDGFIRYASGVAANVYRRLGYKEALVGHHLSELETEDEAIRLSALEQNRCLEWETKEANRIWIRKAIPLSYYLPDYWCRPLRALDLIAACHKRGGVMITLHDATKSRRQDEEIRIKNAMIQEVHHRVKNNLQTIVALLRMKARRVKSAEARLALEETTNRILSVAVIHEFLAYDNSPTINIKEICQRIIAQFQQGILSPDKQIRLKLTGAAISLPARQATACSLVINELLQNAVEHGFEHKDSGTVAVNLHDEEDKVIITVSDTGDGLPAGFELAQIESLGLHIVQVLVEGDLKGQLTLHNQNGLSVTITFPKDVFKGEEDWKEYVSL